MNNAAETFGKFVRAWLMLLAASVVMAGARAVELPRAISVPVVIFSMGFMAWLIGSCFMHLKSEKRTLAWGIVISTFFAAIVLFALIAIDGIRVFHLTPR